MRVLIDYRAALTSPSGVGEYTRQLVAGLARVEPETGHNVQATIFSSSWKDRLVVPTELNGVASIDLRIPVSVLNFAWHRLEWPQIEPLADRAFDVVHSLHPLLLPSRSAAQVVTIHDLDFLTHPERTRAEIRRDYGALAEAHAMRADQVMVPSKSTASDVERRLGVPAERISVVYPGAPDWPPRASAPRAGYILFFGTLEPRKSVGTLLDAYERLIAIAEAASDTRSLPELVLAGKATPEAAGWLERIGRAPLAGRVRHLGYVPSDDRRAIYEGAQMLVQPSFEEGFGLPVLEAMTIGVPVVASNRGALPEVVGDAGLLIEPDDAAMAAAMRRLLDDENLRTACAAAGIERSGQFRARSMAEGALAAYASAVRHRAERRLAPRSLGEGGRVI